TRHRPLSDAERARGAGEADRRGLAPPPPSYGGGYRRGKATDGARLRLSPSLPPPYDGGGDQERSAVAFESGTGASCSSRSIASCSHGASLSDSGSCGVSRCSMTRRDSNRRRASPPLAPRVAPSHAISAAEAA